MIRLRVEGDLTAAPGADTAARTFLDAAGGECVRYAGLVAWDATGRVLSVELRGAASGLDIRVDDEGAVYPLTVDPLLANPAWMVESNQGAAAFGWSVSDAGDVNGDGYSDVIIGDPSHSNGQLGEGRVVAFYGSAGGLGLTSAWSAESNSPQSRYGSSVSTAGDVNADGFSDVLVGAHSYSNGQALEGRAFAYYGSLAGLSSTAGWSVESNQAQANCGISVSSAGDVNGDGYADVIVGAEGFQVGVPPVGRAFVYHGGAAGIDLVEAWSVARARRRANSASRSLAPVTSTLTGTTTS